MAIPISATVPYPTNSAFTTAPAAPGRSVYHNGLGTEPPSMVSTPISAPTPAVTHQHQVMPRRNRGEACSAGWFTASTAGSRTVTSAVRPATCATTPNGDVRIAASTAAITLAPISGPV